MFATEQKKIVTLQYTAIKQTEQLGNSESPRPIETEFRVLSLK